MVPMITGEGFIVEMECRPLMGAVDNASDCATNAVPFALSPDLPVLEERAWGGEALEGHDCPSPAACGPVAPAEGLSGPQEARGAKGPGPHHALTTLCTTPGLAPLPWVRGGP